MINSICQYKTQILNKYFLLNKKKSRLIRVIEHDWGSDNVEDGLNGFFYEGMFNLRCK